MALRICRAKVKPSGKEPIDLFQDYMVRLYVGQHRKVYVPRHSRSEISP